MSTTQRVTLGVMLAIIVFCVVIVKAKSARCDYCTPAPCYSASMCNAGCQCMKPSDFVGGKCVAFK